MSEENTIMEYKTVGYRMKEARKNCFLTRESAADKLGVRKQELAAWEHDEAPARVEVVPKMASIYGVTTDWLLSGKLPSREILEVTKNLSNRMFSETRMYTYVNAYANAKHLYQTLKALPYAREAHLGQYRKERGDERVPYIYHPLIIACQALALGIEEDAVIAAALLHDVCEDCGITPEELPVDDQIREAVRCLTKSPDFDKSREQQEAYFAQIASNRIASVIKVLDRCHNVSGMAYCFDEAHMAKYIIETENYVYPLMDHVRREYPEYDNQMFLVRYHMISVIETVKHYMKAKL